jgi:branched-chain amino acid transport system substrate-binding protein
MVCREIRPVKDRAVSGLKASAVRVLISLALAVIGAACAAALADRFASADEGAIVIGAVYNLTGGQEDLDVPSAQGARLAVALANEKGGVLGRKVTMRLVDGETKPAVIAAKTRMLIAEEPRIAGLIGLSDTDMVLAAAKEAAQGARAFLTSGATSPLLPEQVPQFLFLACFGDNVQAAAGAEFAYDALKARKAAVLFRKGSSYAELLHLYFETRFKELGGEIVAVEPYTLDSIASVAAKLPKADLIYIATLPDGVATVVPAVRKSGIVAPMLGGDGLDIGQAWSEVDEATNVYFTTHAYLGADNPDPEVKAFRAAFARAHPGQEPGAFAALGYDAARMLMAAIEQAGSTEPEAVRGALAQTKDFAGVTGRIGYEDGSQIPLKPVTVMRVNGGRQSFQAAILPKSVPPPH